MTRAGAAPAGGPTDDVVLGIDVGTTAVKVVAFGVGTGEQRSAAREYPLLQPAPGWQVQDPDTVVSALEGALAECVSAVAGRRVLGVSLSTAMHGLIGLDAAKRPLTPLVTWADSRSEQEAATLRDSGEAEVLRRHTGTPVHPMSPLTKLMWFARHEPRLCAAVHHWVGLKDYVLWSLTGVLATELSSASGTGLLDLDAGDWSPFAADLAGVELGQLPTVLDTTAALSLRRGVAAAVGLPAGLPVVTGAADGPLGNLGTGAIDPGTIGISVGTSGAARMVVPRPQLDTAGRLFCYALTTDAWVTGGAVSNGGVVLRWAGQVFGRGEGTVLSDEDLLAGAAEVPAGSEGLVMLPYLLAERAPLWDPQLPGAFLGVRHHHGAAHFVRAAVEGVALQLAAIVDELAGLHPVRDVRVTGGVFRAALWRQVLAAAVGRPLHVAGGAWDTARGAAVLGLVGLGRAGDLPGGLRLLQPVEGQAPAPTEPSVADVEAYRRLRSRVPALLGAYEEVARLFDAPV
ncbi:MAG TPA: gluconokinase [Segeticoccus sp.]|uniref:gluconokinase n=1 Tax=Segeticoccus sp. TaxID=2706531 RepID=UPI002D7EA3E7|nr:gluconokinase [Segeticoccus sp.]HET8601412.1 gluconokinase [Segeticoccus sp.]